MNILLLCTKFSMDENDPWLTNELAGSLQRAGNKVSVVCLDWSGSLSSKKSTFYITSSGTEVFIEKPVAVFSRFPLLSKLFKWGGSSCVASLLVSKLEKKNSYDLVICFSPLVTMSLPAIWLAGLKKKKSLLIQWDFFPYHQRQIGMMPSGLIFNVARKVEGFLISRFKYIGCMSPANISYLRSHYPIRQEQTVFTLPIWGAASQLPKSDRSLVREKYGLPNDQPIIVFGGQLVQGRGIEDILETARLAKIQSCPATFLIIGSGLLECLVDDYISQENSNVVRLAHVPRQEYLEIIATCDLSLVCTVRDVDVPSYPSKTIDYLRVGLPIVASVEKTTDYGEHLAALGVGVYTEAGKPEELLRVIDELLKDPARMAAMKTQGPICFRENFEVDSVVSNALKVISAN